MLFFLLGSQKRSPNPLAWFNEPLRGGEKRGKGRKGGNKKRKERDGRTPPPPNKFMITSLHGASRLFSLFVP